MFQMKFCLKAFETCSLLYVSVLKYSILAIILFKYYCNIRSTGGGGGGGAKIGAGRSKDGPQRGVEGKFVGGSFPLPPTSRAFMDDRTINARVSCAGGLEFKSPRTTQMYTAIQAVRHHFNIYASSCAALAL